MSTKGGKMTRLWTEKDVEKFFAEHPIDTDGAMNQHVIEKEDGQDGDTFLLAKVPFWPQNEYVVRGVLRLVGDAAEKGAHVSLYHGDMDQGFSLTFYYSVCDPD
jgi:hypothetical protein